MVYLAGKQHHKLGNAGMVDHIVELVEKRAAEIEAERGGGGQGGRVAAGIGVSTIARRPAAGLTRARSERDGGRRARARGVPNSPQRYSSWPRNLEWSASRSSSACSARSGRSRSTCTCRRCRRWRPISAPAPQATQFTLTAFFAAFGVSQLVYGPLSDQFGRKPPLYVGLAIFLVGTLGCALAPTIGALIAARLRAGARRGDGDGGAAGDHPRPAHRAGGDAADGDGDAGDLGLADAGAARRQRR